MKKNMYTNYLDNKYTNTKYKNLMYLDIKLSHDFYKNYVNNIVIYNNNIVHIMNNIVNNISILISKLSIWKTSHKTFHKIYIFLHL